MSNSENSEDDNPNESYWKYAAPYDYLYNRIIHRQINGQLAQDLPIVNFEEPATWDPPSALEICENFWFINYHGKKVPRAAYLRKDAHNWIIWFVTDGRIRVDKNRNFYYFQGTSNTVLEIKSSTRNNWRKIDIPNDIFAITELCNEVKSTLTDQLKQFSLLNPSRNFKSIYENLAALPDIVATQRERGPHRNNFWRFQPKRLGGNRGNGKRSPSDENRVASVHKFLCEYHNVFCPKLGNRN